ncbi:MAG TPA: glycosyltransferase family 2 protein, partial [Phycisphaerae bacterium]|nr:glycosyltransferase family 2 protein [Phycisphaerae bacterium]
MPSLAVVICTKDRPESLRRTLASIWPQTRAADELIVIDDGRMSPQLIEQIHQDAARNGIPATIHRNPRTGLTSARNHAADISKSDVLVYLDDDVDCDRDFLREIESLMSDSAVTGVTASVAEPAFESTAGRLYQLGYKIAGWWRVGPRRLPPMPPPRALADPEIAIRARWLSGAAMALRRDIVRRERFDESLTQYALGEDREMGYRLAPHFWLLESRRAQVMHRRETAQRTDSRRLGFMTSRNYLYILEKTCHPGIGQWALIAWSLAILMLMHVAWSLV